MLNRLLLVAVIGGLLPLGSAHYWLLELSSHFRLQYLAVALPLLLIAAIRRRRILGTALAVIVGINVWPLLPYQPLLPLGASLASQRSPASQSSRRPEAAASPSLSILNLNVNASNPGHEGILAAIRGAEAGVVTLIELSPALAARLADIEEDFPYRFLLPAEGNFGLGLLSRYPIAYGEPRELGPTQAIVADIDHPGGRFRLVAVHPLPPMSEDMAATRNSQLAKLAGMVQGMAGPLVVCGDFNLTPYSPWFRRFEAESGLTDVRRGRWPGISWPSFFPPAGIPIDHCFTRAPFAVEAVDRLDPVGSDHYPVRVRLGRPGG